MKSVKIQGAKENHLVGCPSSLSMKLHFGTQPIHRFWKLQIDEYSDS